MNSPILIDNNEGQILLTSADIKMAQEKIHCVTGLRPRRHREHALSGV